MNVARNALACAVASLVSLAGAGPLPADDSEKAEREAALEFMKSSLQGYEATSGDERLKLVPEPLLRWNNPVSGVKHGTFFLWTKGGRPEAAVQVFTAANQDELWLHEFQSLSRGRFRLLRDGKVVWAPEQPGVDPRPLPKAPAPAKTKRGRLVQMRALARRFEASDDFEGKSRWNLRLMTKPMLRYGDESSSVRDGAVFAFVHGTDPEMLLLLEDRQSEDGRSWHYALAPMTGYALQAKLDGKEVWTAKWRKPPFDPTRAFFTTRYQPADAGKDASP